MNAKTFRSTTAVLVVAGLLVALTATPALAGGPKVAFTATGPITTIDLGDVTPAGKSGRFVVKDRHIGGLFFGSIGGGFGESFLFTFGTNVPLLTQSGQIHGVLVAGPYEAAVHAESEIGDTQIPWCAVVPPGTPCAGFVPGLLFGGTVTFTAGAQGHGVVDGWLIPAIDPATGHIVGVLAGQVTITGQWAP